MECTGYDLFAVTGTPITIHGWHTLTLKLGLRREFTWRFVVPDDQIPIIGVDLVNNVSLLVDCRNKRILDGITSLSAPVQTADGRPLRRVPRSHTPLGNRADGMPQHGTSHQNDTRATSILSTRRLPPDRLAKPKPISTMCSVKAQLGSRMVPRSQGYISSPRRKAAGARVVTTGHSKHAPSRIATTSGIFTITRTY